MKTILLLCFCLSLSGCAVLDGVMVDGDVTFNGQTANSDPNKPQVSFGIRIPIKSTK